MDFQRQYDILRYRYGCLTLRDGNGLEADIFPLKPSFSAHYQGTRFDRHGEVFSLRKDGREFIGSWYDNEMALRHDNILGPAEEYGRMGYEEAAVGEGFLKIGVGLLTRFSDEEYDRFKLYPVEKEEDISEVIEPDSYTLIKKLESEKWGYILTRKTYFEDGALKIAHSLQNIGPDTLKGMFYCHNFFTLGVDNIGPDTQIDFPFKPSGHWRDEYTQAHLSESGIRITAQVVPGKSIFMGDLVATGSEKPQTTSFRLSNKSNGLSITSSVDKPFDHMVFWSNNRVACAEPYIAYEIAPGETFTWTNTFTPEIL